MASKPDISLEEAWQILGMDLRAFLIKTRAVQDIQKRIEAVEEAQESAKRVARTVMRDNHPDRAGNNVTASRKFHGAQRALQCIEYYTNSLKSQAEDIDVDAIPARKNLIVIK